MKQHIVKLLLIMGISLSSMPAYTIDSTYSWNNLGAFNGSTVFKL